MVTHAFDYSRSPRVAYCKALSRHTAEIAFTVNGTVQDGITHDDVLLGDDRCFRRWVDHQAPAAQALADIIVTFTDEGHADATGNKGAEALSGSAAQGDADGVFRQAGMSGVPCDLARQHGADSPIGVLDGQIDLYRRAILQGGLRLLNEDIIQGLVQAMVLRFTPVNAHTGACLRFVQDA